jgi:acetyl-CoA carboxylase carboxyl transferase subunit alpha
VISPEGCASILWKSADKARDAAEQMGMTAPRLLEHGLVDRIIKEPLGGAHRDPAEAAKRIKAAVLGEVEALERLDLNILLEQRYARLRRYGSHQAA